MQKEFPQRYGMRSEESSLYRFLDADGSAHESIEFQRLTSDRPLETGSFWAVSPNLGGVRMSRSFPYYHAERLYASSRCNPILAMGQSTSRTPSGKGWKQNRFKPALKRSLANSLS